VQIRIHLIDNSSVRDLALRIKDESEGRFSVESRAIDILENVSDGELLEC
jgi:hypothetical protein